MTPKEKANELVDKCRFALYDNLPSLQSEIFKQSMTKASKQCALVAVDEILNSFGLTANGQTFFTEYRAVQFWNEVKQEIENL